MSVQVDFLKGDQVRIVPGHAYGDCHHPDCELGEVTGTNGGCVFVRFGGKGYPQPCDPDTVHLVARP